MLTFSEFLKARGYSPDEHHVKMVRHRDSRFDVEDLLRSGHFERYQQFQSGTIFDGCEQIIAFIGEEGSKSRFVGVFDVGSRQHASQAQPPRGANPPKWIAGAKYWYPIVRRPGFADLENRIVIDWGKGTRSWHQWFKEREVLEVRPEGRFLPPFRDYLRVHLSMSELRALANNPGAHADWVASLRAVGGIYLIVSSQTGQQYVGSATGDEGIWQRWQMYAKTGHCGNSRLVELCAADKRHPGAFMFSILEPFSRTTARDVALAQEAFFKRKLGSRAFGLNDN